MSEKLCVFCAHLNMEGDTGGEYGEPAKFFCEKNRWAGIRARRGEIWPNEIPIHGCTALEEFRAVIRFAEKCPDYTPPR